MSISDVPEVPVVHEAVVGNRNFDGYAEWSDLSELKGEDNVDYDEESLSTEQDPVANASRVRLPGRIRQSRYINLEAKFSEEDEYEVDDETGYDEASEISSEYTSSSSSSSSSSTDSDSDTGSDILHPDEEYEVVYEKSGIYNSPNPHDIETFQQAGLTLRSLVNDDVDILSDRER
jgi:hypothetical protein